MQEEDHVYLAPSLSNLLQIETLINESEFITDKCLKATALIVSTEIFCNIVEHGNVPESTCVDVHIIKDDLLKIKFVYETPNFDKLLKKAKELKPYYDEKSKRYRGLGMIMLKNLSKNIDYKKGISKSAIIVTL